MSHYYLTGYVGTGTDATPGVPADPFRPAGTDGQASWSSIDLRPNSTNVAGKCFLAVPVRDDTGIGGRYLGQDPLATVPAIVITRLGNDLGVTLTSTTFDQLLLEILTVQARTDGTRWRPLVATNRRQQIWLGGQAIVDIPVVGGGAVYTESFNKADSTILGPDLTWTETKNDLQVVSNKVTVVTAISACRARAESDMATNDNYAKITASTATSSDGDVLGAICRYSSGADTGYLGFWTMGFTTCGIAKVVAGTVTNLVTNNPDGVFDTNVLYIEADGSTITSKLNGSVYLTTTDTAITTGTRGGVSVAQATGIQGDNFEMGDIRAPVVVTPLPDNIQLFTAGPGLISPSGILHFTPPFRGEDEIHTGITVTVDGHGDVASTGNAELLLTADLNSHGDIAATGTAELLLLADLQSHGDAASAGRAEPLLLADLQGHGDVASAGRADLLLLADLSGDGEIANAGIAELLLLADLSGHGDASTTGAADITVTPQGGSAVSLDGHGDIASAGQADALLTADLQGDGEAANTGRAELLVLLDLAGDGEVACAGTASLTVTLDLSGHGDVATAGAAAITAALDLAGHGDASTTGQLLTDVIAAVVAADGYTTGARRNRILTITVIFRYPKRLHQTCEITARARHYCPRGTHTRIRTEMTQQERFTPRSAYRVRVMTEADRVRDDLEAITTLFRAR